MNDVLFLFYSHRPRLRIDFVADLPTVPVVGDFIHLPGSAIAQIGNNVVGNKTMKCYGIDFIVIKREFYIYDRGLPSISVLRWTLYLALKEPLVLTDEKKTKSNPPA